MVLASVAARDLVLVFVCLVQLLSIDLTPPVRWRDERVSCKSAEIRRRAAEESSRLYEKVSRP
jgi:hypothetical protein